MKRSMRWLVVMGFLAAPFLAAADKDTVPGPALSFTLKDAAGKTVALSDFKSAKAVAVVFIGTECPLVNMYVLRLKELHQKFADKDVQFIAINSNSQDTVERIAEHAKTAKIPFPVLIDADQRVAGLFGAERTPEVFLLSGSRRIVYRGRIDDQYGIGFQRAKATKTELVDAINQVLASQPVAVAKTDAPGCLIGRTQAEKSDSKITYTNQVARILQDRCLECHRPGEIAPLNLTKYEKVRGWAGTIREVISERRMPPWHADPRYGHFVNDRRLSDEDRATLLAWIDAGCPKGDDKDLPPPKRFRANDGWGIGKPDQIFTMTKDFTVPAEAPGGVPYMYFQIPTEFTEDRWVTAAEARPGNRAVVHHILVYVVGPGERINERSEDVFGDHFLVGTAPGDMPGIYPPGTAKKIPKGSRLLLQLHYTPNGVEQNDRSSVGVVFAKEPPKQVVHTRAIANMRFAIPPGDGNHKATSTTVFKKDAMLLSFMPHMHLRGKAFEYKIVYPDGKEEIPLSVPRFDFGWQTSYKLKQPLRLPAGTRIDCTAYFDNSTNNPNNPDPTKTIRWGDQTWDEMLIGWVDYYYAEEKP